MRIVIPLLGTRQLNNHRPQGCSLVPKYIGLVTADQIAGLLQYTREKGKHPFKLSDNSIIKIDKRIQRGTNDAGFHAQEKSKVDAVAEILLGKDKDQTRAFLGTLVWNIRPPSELEAVTTIREGRPPEAELRIDTAAIFLTDSAHRHLAIAESHHEYLKSPTKYPRYNSKLEFPVEIYNLDENGEQELFIELNSKQKKISPAKAKELDNASPFGWLKGHVRAHDAGHDLLFDQNIEVSSRTNDRHTLMTMSAFVASLKEMFSAEEVTESKNDHMQGDSDAADEIAKYYCDFFKKLHDTIEVKFMLKDKEEKTTPYYNLYASFIREHDDSDDNTIELHARKAKDYNAAFRQQDISNNNAMIRVLCRIGRLIRRMQNWRSVIDNIQTSLVVPARGRFFQLENEELLSPQPSGIPIATRNENNTINMQIQTKTISVTTEYLLRKLFLKKEPALSVISGSNHVRLMHEDSGPPNYTINLSRTDLSFIELEAEFFIGSLVNLDRDQVRVAFKPDEWTKGRITGKKSITTKLTIDDGYVDEYYDTDIKRVKTRFTLKLPKYSERAIKSFFSEITLEYPNLAGESQKASFHINCQPGPN